MEWPDDLPAARAPFLMRGGAARLVRALKYAGWTDLARPMGAAMASAARTLLASSAEDGPSTRPPGLVPVPLSAARHRRRGFNQASHLAASLGDRLGWPVMGALRRAGRGGRQARLGGASRRENVRGRFRSRRAPDGVSSALVVDDVVTTGSTAAACAAALRGAGWRPLGAVAFARTVSAAEPVGTGREGDAGDR